MQSEGSVARDADVSSVAPARVRAFRAAWPGAPDAQLDGLAAQLDRLIAEAARDHAIDEARLLSAIGARAPAEPGEVPRYLERCHARELAIALAAAAGAPDAIAELEASCGAAMDAVCRRFANAAHTVDDLRQILRAKLLVAQPGRAPKLADYAGQGFLENWLRVTAVRVFLDLDKRKDRAREETSDEDTLLALASPEDLELGLIKAEHRAAVASALREAAHQLEPGERQLLRQHLVAGLSIDQLGAVLGIHRATAARRIERAKAALATATRRVLRARLGLSAEGLDDLLALVMSGLDVSLARLLATAPRRAAPAP